MKYSSEFKCLKDKCPHNCCTNTEIKLSVIDMLKLNEINFNDFTIYFDIKTGYPYGIMNNKNNKCPLLKNNLCTIYDKTINKTSRLGQALIKKNLSLRANPLICRAYPKMIFYPEEGELALNSGCKDVPKQKWEYVVKDDLMKEIVYETSIYRLIVKNLTKKPMKELAKLIIKKKFFRLILKTLERINPNNIEKVKFTKN